MQMTLRSPGSESGHTLGLLALRAYTDWDRRQELGYPFHLTYSMACGVGLSCLSHR